MLTNNELTCWYKRVFLNSFDWFVIRNIMIEESELIVNDDGSIFHLHLKPGELADTVLLVGDPGRVEMISSKLDETELKVSNREFVSVTGRYRGHRLSVVSTGIGTDNIDIVVNELDALVNIDLEKREILPGHRSLRLVRIGTSGGLQRDLPVGSWVVSHKSVGFDGMLSYYAGRDSVSDLDFEEAFRTFTGWPVSFPSPYVVDASPRLLAKFSGPEFARGVNISAPGFYGPQGRELRLPLALPHLNEQLEAFSFEGYKITNYEMESSAIYGLSALLGHEALTVCLLIANRMTRGANESYHGSMERLVEAVLNHLIR